MELKPIQLLLPARGQSQPCSYTSSLPHPPPLPAAFSISHRTPSLLPVEVFAHLCAEPGQGADPSQKNSLQLYFSFQLEEVLSGFLGGCTSTWAGIREGKRLGVGISHSAMRGAPEGTGLMAEPPSALTRKITALFSVMPQVLPTLLSRNAALPPSVSSTLYQKASPINQQPLEQPAFQGVPLMGCRGREFRGCSV